MMLVLSRRVGEKIMIPGLGITVEVVSLKGKSVQLGIDAPPEIRILRGELTGLLAGQNGSVEKELPTTSKESKVDYRVRKTTKKSNNQEPASRRIAV